MCTNFIFIVQIFKRSIHIFYVDNRKKWIKNG